MSGGCHQQVQPAKAQSMMSSKTEPHICRPLYLLGTRPAAVTCSVMALKESALTQVQEDVEPDISLLMPRGSGCRLIPLLSPEAEPPLPPGISGFNQPPLGVTLSPITAHLGRALVSAAAGRLPRRVHSTGGVAVGTSCNSTLSCSKGLLLRCQDWRLAESGTGLVTNLPQQYCPEGLEEKCHPVLQLRVRLQQEHQ